MEKSPTDIHWNNRAKTCKEKAKVNIADTCQRELETDFLLANLPEGARVLEVGCGNGFLTGILRERAGHVDAFDFSINMIHDAMECHGEKNNRFFQDNILDPMHVKPPYDVVVCVRVLINLRNLEQQKRAISNLSGFVKTNGVLLLIEGFSDGFSELNKLRSKVGMPALKPAAINFYCSLSDLMPEISRHFTVKSTFHTGTFDFLTRVVYPALVGAENASGPADFHEKILPVARSFNPPDSKPLARVHGFALEKKE